MEEEWEVLIEGVAVQPDPTVAGMNIKSSQRHEVKSTDLELEGNNEEVEQPLAELGVMRAVLI